MSNILKTQNGLIEKSSGRKIVSPLDLGAKYIARILYPIYRELCAIHLERTKDELIAYYSCESINDTAPATLAGKPL